MPESHEDIARVVDRDHGPQQITIFRREDTSTGPALCASVLVQSPAICDTSSIRNFER